MSTGNPIKIRSFVWRLVWLLNNQVKFSTKKWLRIDFAHTVTDHQHYAADTISSIIIHSANWLMNKVARFNWSQVNEFGSRHQWFINMLKLLRYKQFTWIWQKFSFALFDDNVLWLCSSFFTVIFEHELRLRLCGCLVSRSNERHRASSAMRAYSLHNSQYLCISHRCTRHPQKPLAAFNICTHAIWLSGRNFW